MAIVSEAPLEDGSYEIVPRSIMTDILELLREQFAKIFCAILFFDFLSIWSYLRFFAGVLTPGFTSLTGPAARGRPFEHRCHHR